MKRPNALFLATIFGLLLHAPSAISQAQGAGPSWKLVATHVEPKAPTLLGDHTILAAFSNETGAEFEISTVTFVKNVVQVAVNGDRVTIIGTGAGPDEAITINAGSRSVVSRSLARDMRIFANKWLVSVEWYPNHLFPPQYPNDVVLVQDIQNGSQSCSNKPGDDLSQVSTMVRAAGRPVYPPRNAAECSYSNVHDNDDSIYRVYPKTFALTSDGRLLFLTSSGPDRDVHVLSLVEIPLAPAFKGKMSELQQSLASVYGNLKLDNNEMLQVDHLESLNEGAVRIVFTKGAYPVDQVVVPLRSP